MANHKSALKRIRSNETRRIRNRYQAKTMRNALKKFRSITDKKEASEKLPELFTWQVNWVLSGLLIVIFPVVELKINISSLEEFVIFESP